MEGEHSSLVDNSTCLESYNAQSCQEYLHLHNDNNNDTSNDDESSSTKSSVSQTTFNMVKMCIGTGSLAIPFAASEGGLLFFAIGTFIVVLWNAYDVYLLLDARQYITSSCSEESKAKSKDNNDDDDDHGVVENQLPRSTVTVTVGEDTSLNSLSKVALHVFGKYGSNAIDFLMILLMVGIIVAYEDAILGFTSETLLTTGSKRIDALWMIVAITPFLLPNSYEGAAHLSILGSGLIAAAFIVIGLYGIKENNNDGLSGFGFHHLLSLSMWPRNFASFSKWFGVVVFGVGVVPFSYSLQESMENPDQMMQATKRSLGIVYIAYSMIGCVISIIFSHGIETDIISSLPRGYIPDGLRIVMSLMVCSTVPLISIPAGELINEKVQFLIGNIDDGLGSGSGSGSGSGNGFKTRLILVVLCGIVSVETPNFCYVSSFLGCCCVSIMSFVFPPFLHLVCLYQYCPREKLWSKKGLIIFDIVLLLLGVVTTAFTSFLTFGSMVEQMRLSRL
uniref:Amino acid transporter transmembrane domain-containing protein n=1 Tax=Chaetoceros debilis TaxID=122233 RepID=A0A7S3Q796_9STRA